jgi:hypothetical protein
MSSQDSRRSAELLGGLLGPGRAELTCEECFERLDGYVELELAGRDADASVVGMRSHLEGCPACAEDHASLRDFITSQRSSGAGE